MEPFAKFGHCGGKVADSHICFFQICQILLYFFFIETALVDNAEDSSGEVFNERIGDIKMTVGVQFPDGVGCARKGNFLKNRYKYIGYAAPVRG